MKTKKYLFLTLFLLSATMSLHALPMEEDQLPIEEKDIASKVANPVDTAGVRAHDARVVADAGRSTAQSTSYSNIAVSETDQTTSTSVADSIDPIDDSPEGLAQKISEANEAAAAWEQEYERIAVLPNISVKEAAYLGQKINYFAAYWRQELDRYNALVEAFDKNQQTQQCHLIGPVIDACEEAIKTLGQTQEQLGQLKKTEASTIASKKMPYTNIAAIPSTSGTDFHLQYYDALIKAATQMASQARDTLTANSMSGGNPTSRDSRIRTAIEASSIADMLSSFVSDTAAKKGASYDKTPLFPIQQIKNISNTTQSNLVLKKAVVWEAMVAESVASARTYLETASNNHAKIQKELEASTQEVTETTADVEGTRTSGKNADANLKEAAINTIGVVPGAIVGHLGPLLIEGGKLTKAGIGALAARWAKQKTKAQAADATANLEYAFEKEIILESIKNSAASLCSALEPIKASAEAAVAALVENSTSQQTLAMLKKAAEEEVEALRMTHVNNLIAWANTNLEEAKSSKTSRIAVLVAQGYEAHARSILSAVTSRPDLVEKKEAAVKALARVQSDQTALQSLFTSTEQEFNKAKENFKAKYRLGMPPSRESEEYKIKHAAKIKYEELEKVLSEVTAAVAQVEKELSSAIQKLEEVNARLAIWDNLKAWHAVAMTDLLGEEISQEKTDALLPQVPPASLRAPMTSSELSDQKKPMAAQQADENNKAAQINHPNEITVVPKSIGGDFAKKAIAENEELAELQFGHETRAQKEAAAKAYHEMLTGSRGTSAKDLLATDESDDSTEEELNASKEKLSNLETKYTSSLAEESFGRTEAGRGKYMEDKYGVISEEGSEQDTAQAPSTMNTNIASDMMEATDARIAMGTRLALESARRAYDEGVTLKGVNAIDAFSSSLNIPGESEEQKRLREFRQEEFNTQVMSKTYVDAQAAKDSFEKTVANKKRFTIPKKK